MITMPKDKKSQETKFKMKYNYDMNYQNGIHFFAFQIDNFEIS